MASSTFTVTDPGALANAVDPIVAQVANSVANAARTNTPRASGRLAAGWRVARDGTGRWRVTNDVPYARFVEYGTSRTPARAMLGRATAQARSASGR